MTFSEKILEAAEEGIVLLKNEAQTLPLVQGETVNIFGRIQYDFYRSGTGSGGSVHVPYTTNLTDSLAALKSCKINEKLSSLYKKWINENPFNNGTGEWASEPYSQQDMEITEELAEECLAAGEKALYVIGRVAGEDKDYVAEKGSWYLTETEEKNLEVLCKVFKKVTVIFNTSGIMDTAWINDRKYKNHITAVVYAWQGGQEAGRALANVLAGKTVPSAKLTDTIPLSIKDFPSTEGFGGSEVFYKEDIYVGYRYFNTFAKNKILYPFGFGLSYAQFKLESAEGEITGEGRFKVRATVRNISKDFPGKEVVQLYCDFNGKLLQTPSRRLVAFAKTGLLLPGQSQTVEMEFSEWEFASYDDTGATGASVCDCTAKASGGLAAAAKAADASVVQTVNKSCWVLEAGLYHFFAGNSSLADLPVKISGSEGILLEKTKVLEKLEQACAPFNSFNRIKKGKQLKDGTFRLEEEPVPLNQVDIAERIKKNLPEEIPFTGNRGISFGELKTDETLLDEFVAQLTKEQLATFVRGEGMLSRKVTPGIASAFGGLSQSLHDDYHVPCAGCSDGPSGIRMDTGKEANLMPIGTQLACSWNLQLITELYEFEGEEIYSNKIDVLLGPGMNIHRNPLNGRNFEYFSEDPLVTGLFACAELRGLKKYGVSGTIKHFAANSQEFLRHTTNSNVSERALREIYLKGFEIAVKKGGADSIMTSYNKVNNHWTASNYELVNTILHKDWGYTGLVMTDWWASMNNCVDEQNATVKNTANMVRSRNNVYMVVDNDGSEKNIYGDNLLTSIEDGSLTLAELQLCVKDILSFLIHTNVSNRPLGELVKVERFAPLTEAELSRAKAAGAAAVKSEDEIIPQAKKLYLMEVLEDGIYAVGGFFCKVENTLSQSASIIKVNGQPAASFECRTTNGNNIYVNASQIRLQKGFYTIELEHIKPGIELKTLVISDKNFNPVLAGYIE